MTYRELLDLYKKGELEGLEKQKLEQDIERHEAIGDYLIDKEEAVWARDCEQLREITGSTDRQNTAGSTELQENQHFVRMIKRSIYGLFFKTGLIISVFTITVALFVIFCLPRVVDSFYYNPALESYGDTNQISLDMAVYTELLMPAYNRQNVAVQSNGYGNYDITIYQNVSYNGNFNNVSGRIEKGRLKLYDINLLKEPAGNAFAWFQMEGDSLDSLRELEAQGVEFFNATGDRTQTLEGLQNLEEGQMYVAYITLDEMMPYEEFMEYLKENPDAELGNTWCAVCTYNGVEELDTSRNGTVINEGGEEMTVRTMFRAENMGFNCSLRESNNLQWDRDTYPLLRLWDNAAIASGEDEDIQEDMQREDYMLRHFTSMLRYLSRQEEFLNMMGRDAAKLAEAADYVEENGLMVYGYAGIGNREQLLALMEKPEVYSVYPQELR